MFPRTFFLVTSILLAILVAIPAPAVLAQSDEGDITLARMKYRGGGDWYNDPSSLTNLIAFANREFNIPLNPQYDNVDVGSKDLFDYPFVFMTGHGNVNLNRFEQENLRTYLKRGGFLYIDDDYGIDEYIRPLLNGLFPDQQLVEIPFEYPIYQSPYSFTKGLPKIHEHDRKSPRGYGLFHDGRLVLFYTVESNLGDGWADAEIHNNPESLRKKALQMGTNILLYALTQ